MNVNLPGSIRYPSLMSLHISYEMFYHGLSVISSRPTEKAEVLLVFAKVEVFVIVSNVDSICYSDYFDGSVRTCNDTYNQLSTKKSSYPIRRRSNGDIYNIEKYKFRNTQKF